jgi:putative ABC transport system substrate-binding protein
MRRREFITLLGGAAAWPLAARAQQVDRVRSVGVLLGRDESDPVAKTYVSEFTQALMGLGWAVGRNLRIDIRWTAGSLERMRRSAKELVDLRNSSRGAAVSVHRMVSSRGVGRSYRSYFLK